MRIPLIWFYVVAILAGVGTGFVLGVIRRLKADLKEAQKSSRHWFALYCMVRDLKNGAKDLEEP